MFSKSLLALCVVLIDYTNAQSSIVKGKAPGFASGVTGGGNAAPVYPTNINDLKKYLTSTSPQNIVISSQFNFVGSEGSRTFAACNPYSCTPANGGQSLLNTVNGCTGTLTNVNIDLAGYQGINVASDKTLVGQGKNAILNGNGMTTQNVATSADAAPLGKGLRFSGVSNIIIQNIAITNLNPKYVWGGDALSFSNTNKIWIDHVTTSLTGRQHYSFGQASDKGITVSNSFINGATSNSASCNGHTYWGFEMVGQGDTITLYQNYIKTTSGRSPAVSGTTVLHAVNNVFEDNAGHLIEGGQSGAGLFEGNVFKSIGTTLQSDFSGQLFAATSSNAGQCAAVLGRNCQANSFSSAGAFNRADNLFSKFQGLTFAPAASAASIAGTVPAQAGNTL